MKSWIITAVAGLLAATALADAPLTRVRIYTPGAEALAAELQREFDVLDGSVTETTVDLVVSDRSFQLLRDRGFEPWVIDVGRPFKDIQAEQHGDIPAGYPNLAGIYADMNAKAAAFPDICQMVDITATYEQPSTYEERHLYAVKISDNVAQNEDEPAIMIVGNYHAREIVAPVICLYAIDRFTSLYGSDPNIAQIVNNYEIWVMPTANPDGYNYMYTVDNYWRKNRRVFATGTGVDNNRNYPFGWDTACAGDSDPSSDIYKGPSAGSEAETHNIMDWSQDRHFTKIIDYHCYGREVLWAYDCLTHPFGSWLLSEAAGLSTASGYGGATRVPSAEGEHFEWQLAYMGAMANLIETATAFQPSYTAAQAEAAMVWPGILWQIQRPIPLWGYVTDSVTGAAVSTNVNLVGVTFTNGEVNPTGRFGRYNWFLPAGTYSLSLSANGYDPKTVSGVVVTAGQSTRLDIPLNPPPDFVYPNGGESLYQNQPVTVAWTGRGPDMRYQVQATSNYGQVQQITDSFERTTLGTDYVTGGSAPWFTTTTYPLMGSRSCRAGAIGHSQSSWMTRSVLGGNVSFWYLVSSEANDYFNFYVDGVRQIHASGQGAWTNYATTLPAGSHELKWEYIKNASAIGGNDSVWIDYLQLTAVQTTWTDVLALSDVGATSTTWTPTTLSSTCKLRIRSYYPGGAYGVWGETDATFSVVVAPPMGACCHADGSCTLETQSACAAGSGAYQGDGTGCSPNNCPQPTGACCASDGSCSVVTEAACGAGGGTYQGTDTSCDPNPCAPPVCRGDCNCDGAVGFPDIDLFVAAIPNNQANWATKYQLYFGIAPPGWCWENTDVNGVGTHAGFDDIDPFVAKIPSACPR